MAWLNKNQPDEHITFIFDKKNHLVGASTWKVVKKAADELGIRMSDKEFHCAASWIFINKGLPSEADYQRARDFACSMTE